MKNTEPDTKIAHYLAWSIAGILSLLPFHAFLTSWAGNNFGHLDLFRTWAEILIIGLFIPAIYLVVRDSNLRKNLLKSKILWLYFTYILLHLVFGYLAYRNNQVNKTALAYGLLINLRFIGFFLLCLIVASKTDILHRAWQKILLIPAVITIVFGVLQRLVLPVDFLRYFYGYHTIPTYQTVDNNINLARIISTFRGSNPFGAYLVLAVPGFLVSLKNRILVKFMILAGAVLCLWFSYSRSAWIGLFFTLAALVSIYFAKSLVKRFWPLLIVILIAGLVSLSYVAKINQATKNIFFHSGYNTSTVPSSDKLRASLMKDAFKDVTSRQPLGRGPGTAGPASFRNTPNQPRIAEDYYLQIGQEVGVEGLVLFIAICALVFKALWQQKSDSLAMVLLVSFIGISLINLVSHAWTDDTLSLLWWGFAGIALAPTLINRQARKSNV